MTPQAARGAEISCRVWYYGCSLQSPPDRLYERGGLLITPIQSSRKSVQRTGRVPWDCQRLDGLGHEACRFIHQRRVPLAPDNLSITHKCWQSPLRSKWRNWRRRWQPRCAWRADCNGNGAPSGRSEREIEGNWVGRDEAKRGRWQTSLPTGRGHASRATGCARRACRPISSRDGRRDDRSRASPV